MAQTPAADQGESRMSGPKLKSGPNSRPMDESFWMPYCACAGFYFYMTLWISFTA